MVFILFGVLRFLLYGVCCFVGFFLKKKKYRKTGAWKEAKSYDLRQYFFFKLPPPPKNKTIIII